MVTMGASPFWAELRRSPRGDPTLRELARQLLAGVAACHRARVTHRDLKARGPTTTCHSQIPVPLQCG
jgi:serine/threonine protein kinase